MRWRPRYWICHMSVFTDRCFDQTTSASHEAACSPYASQAGRLECLPVLPRPSPHAHVEALWKQEGTKCCQFLRNLAHGPRRAGRPKWRKCRRDTQTSTIVRGSFETTHNLKVVGSNPTPATKFNHNIKDLNAAPRGGVRVSTTRGSTVEARGGETPRAIAKRSA